MADEKTPVVWDDTTKKHRPLGTGEKMGGLDASSMLSSDAGNLLQSGSDGLAYLSGSGMVDPRADNLLEESDQGKLQVTVDRIAEWLDGHPQDAAALADAMNVVSTDAGNIIVQGTDKGAYLSNAQLAGAFAGLTDAQKQAIAQAIAAKMAAQLADGKTIVASNGKLTSDPTNATAAQKAAINGALADADSGLVVDPSTGKLTVDFSQMPTDKFEDLLKGMKMQIPLEANLNLYVDDDSDGDSIVDGRGTAAKPFKSIGAAVSYATQTYALGTHHVYIRVKAGTYSMNPIALPKYTTTTGRITILSQDGYEAAVVSCAQAVPVAALFRLDGSEWNLTGLKFDYSVATPSSGHPHNYVPLSAANGAVCNIRACTFNTRYSGDSTAHGVQVHGVNASRGSQIHLIPDAMGPIAVKVSKGLSDGGNLFYMDTSSSMMMDRSDVISDASLLKIFVSGTATAVLRASDDSSILMFGSGANRFDFAIPSGESLDTTYTYNITNSSSLSLGGATVPGTGTTNVESATYCWVKA